MNILGIDQEDLSLMILPYLFKPLVATSGYAQNKGPKIGKKNNGTKENLIWKPSKPEIAEGFIFRVNVSLGLLMGHK